MLGVRLDMATEESLGRLARVFRRSKSEIAREAIARHVAELDEALVTEARRQSLHAAAHDDPEDDAFWASVGIWDEDA